MLVLVLVLLEVAVEATAEEPEPPLQRRHRRHRLNPHSATKEELWSESVAALALARQSRQVDRALGQV